MRLFFIVVLLFFLSEDTELLAQGSYTIDPVSAGLTIPVRMAFAPEGSGRIFYLELQTGNVQVINGTVAQNGSWLHVDVDNQGERGLLGIVFDPDFSNNHYIYIYYTAPFTTPRNRVERYTEVNFRADTSSRMLLYEQSVSTPCGTFLYHNAGALTFGADKKLYISVGENLCSQLAEELSDPRGKILRIEPDIPAPNNAVTTNPFYDDGNSSSGRDDRIFAIGLRNSFGMTLSNVDSSIYATENGPDCNDEVNRILIGHDYGWRPECQSGPTHCSCPQDAPYTPPLWRITPTIAPTGITVYRGNLYPELEGKVLFVDYNVGIIRAGTINPAKDSLNVVIISQPGLGPLYDIVEGIDGYIYFSYTNGISRLMPLNTDVRDRTQPSTYTLSQNFPNPFNPETTFEYEIAHTGFVSVKVLDVFGETIATLVNEVIPSGMHKTRWDATSFPSGVYFCRLTTSYFSQTRKMLFLR